MSDGPVHMDPRNPFDSYLVSASAGSGKTFQLSRRFLALVMAGADPASILTVTYTRKAASEMRERIIHDAAKLLTGHPEFDGFHHDISALRSKSNHPNLPPLRTAREAGRAIIAATQSLRITTIDSVFVDWCQRFPVEAGLTLNGETLSPPWDIATGLDLKEIQDEAWLASVRNLARSEDADQVMESIIKAAPGEKLQALWHRMAPLRSSDTFVWLCELLHDKALKLHPLPDDVPEDASQFIVTFADDLAAITREISNKDKREGLERALKAVDFEDLSRFELVTKQGLIHRRTVSKKIQEKLPAVFERLATGLSQFAIARSRRALNDEAALIWAMFHAWRGTLHHLKVKRGLASFSDALKGATSLFQPSAQGAFWLIQNSVRHLMLDEFQDTSRLQWSIFEQLARELLSGGSRDAGLLPATVFIVGDAKQSIYGFREAAPEVMDLALESLGPLGLKLSPMNLSWRTAGVVLDVVNQVFAGGDLIANFPAHGTARRGNQLAVPDVGSVTVLPAIVPGPDDTAALIVEAEANQVAMFIRECLEGKNGLLMPDKATGDIRTPIAGDFAILYRNATHAHVFEAALRSLDIPALREEKRGFFGRQEICDLVALIQWLTWPSDRLALCSVLKSPMGGLNDRELQELLLSSDGAAHPSPSIIIQRLMDRHPDLSAALAYLRDQRYHAPPHELLLWWLQKRSAIESYCASFGALEGELAAANIIKLIDLVRAAESDGHGNLHALRNLLDSFAEDDETGNAATSANAVRLMTAHKSKGLEFGVVIVVDTASDWYASDSIWTRCTAPHQEGMHYIGSASQRLADDPWFAQLAGDAEDLGQSEQARLLYVALTRARHHLVLTGSLEKPRKSDSKRAENLDDATPSTSHQTYHMRLTDAVRVLGGICDNGGSTILRRDHCPSSLRQSNLPNAIGSETVPLPRSLPFKTAEIPALRILAPSQRQTQDKISRQKTDESSSASYGILVHKLLESHVRKREVTDRSLRRLIDASSEDAPTVSAMTAMISRARAEVTQVLASSAWASIIAGATQFYAEMRFSRIIDDQLIYGQPDLVVSYETGRWAVVDFKTSRVAENDDLIKICDERGYSGQLRAYADALEVLTKTKISSKKVLFTAACTCITLP